MANSPAATAYPKCKFIRAKTLGIKCHQVRDPASLLERVARKGRPARLLWVQHVPRVRFHDAALADS